MNQPTDDPADVLPWELPGATRMDCESHRAEFLSWLSLIAFWLCALLPCTVGISGLVGLPLAVGVCWMARTDLQQMDRGLMDSDGRDGTYSAFTLAVGTVAISGLLVPGCAVLVWVVLRA